MGHYDDIRDEHYRQIHQERNRDREIEVLQKIKSGHFKKIINATLLIDEESKLVSIKISDLEAMVRLLDK